MKKHRYSFWIGPVEAAGLKLVKAEEGTTEGEQIRAAIREFLRRKGVWETARRRAGGRTRREG